MAIDGETETADTVEVGRQPGQGAWAVPLLVVTPLIGAGLLGVASASPGLFRLLVREDGVLEWAQVVAYVALVAVVAVSVRASWRRERKAALVMVVLAMLALLSIGEELSWGQRLAGFGTPEIASQNRQGELNFHNDARLEQATRVTFFLAGLFGLATPFLVRRTPFVPPLTLVTFFGVVAGYAAYRLLFLSHPTYAQAKYSEWPELCLAAGLLLWCASLTRRQPTLAPDA